MTYFLPCPSEEQPARARGAPTQEMKHRATVSYKLTVSLRVE